MTLGERASIVGSVAVLTLLLVGGWLAANWREETRDALRSLASTYTRPTQTLTAEWPSGDTVQRLTTHRDVGETFDAFLTRHRDCVRAAGGD